MNKSCLVYNYNAAIATYVQLAIQELVRFEL